MSKGSDNPRPGVSIDIGARADVPCTFAETWQSTRHPALAFGGAVLCSAIGGRMIWNVWRGQG
jgi:hypothetical protein